MQKDAITVYVNAITNSGYSIYDAIEMDTSQLWVPTPVLEQLLNGKLVGISLHGYALRTRSKVVKEHVCQALGCPVPKSFKKTQPRFPGQQMDVYIQKSHNLQIWNEEIAVARRYAIIQVSTDDVITKVKVINGDMLVKLDTTGTLTQKYQAKLTPKAGENGLLLSDDTEHIKSLFLLPEITSKEGADTFGPLDMPSAQTFLSISSLFQTLHSLVGHSFADAGRDQE
ncbi:MAG: hypothetical protein AAF639_34220 [Chloroflexota bacterium]